jgi:hypothetical protein
VRASNCPMLLLFFEPEVATLKPVGPSKVGVYEALSDDAVLLPPSVVPSWCSNIPVGGAVAALPLVPKKPTTRMPGIEVVTGGAVT